MSEPKAARKTQGSIPIRKILKQLDACRRAAAAAPQVAALLDELLAAIGKQEGPLTLTPRQREALSLYYLQEEARPTQRQVAEQMGCREKQVGRHLARAVGKLEKAVNKGTWRRAERRVAGLVDSARVAR